MPELSHDVGGTGGGLTDEKSYTKQSQLEASDLRNPIGNSWSVDKIKIDV